MPRITIEKNDTIWYDGRNGTGYVCGLEVELDVNRVAIRPVNATGRLATGCTIHVPTVKVEEFIDLLRDAAKTSAPKEQISVESLMAQYGNWGDHETYDREAWMQAVAMKDTQRGYWDWVQLRLEVDEEGKS